MSATNSGTSREPPPHLAEPSTAVVGEALTRQKLYRFGAVIGVTILVLTVVSKWSTQNQTDQVVLRNGIADTRDHALFGDMFYDEIRAPVFASGLTSQLGADVIESVRVERDESAVGFIDEINAAIAINADSEITRQLQVIVPQVQTYGDDSVAHPTRWADFDSADSATRAAAKNAFTTWEATFESLKTTRHRL